MKKELKFNRFKGICANNKESIMTKTISHKKYADFQSNYRRSLNFGRALKKEKWVLNENGELILKLDKAEESL